MAANKAAENVCNFKKRQELTDKTTNEPTTLHRACLDCAAKNTVIIAPATNIFAQPELLQCELLQEICNDL